MSLPDSPQVHKELIPEWLDLVEWRSEQDVAKWLSRGLNETMVLNQLSMEYEHGGPLDVPFDPYTTYPAFNRDFPTPWVNRE